MVDYSKILNDCGVHYLEKDQWLLSKNITNARISWPLMIGIKAIHMETMLKRISPVLSDEAVGFRIIKNDVFHRQVNEGRFIEKNAKAMVILPDSEEKAIEIARIINGESNNLTGPMILGALRIGNLLYADITKEKLRFPVKRQFRQEMNQRKIGKHYLLHSVLSDRPKGRTLKLISLKNLSFNWCIAKEAKMGMGEDEQGREIRERLIWEKNVLTELREFITVPRVIEFLEHDENSYLVMEFIDGSLFQNTVDKIYRQRKGWKNLGRDEKRSLLEYYSRIIELIISMHNVGFVHRDITDSNFIVTKKGKIVAIDFELTCSLHDGQPDPPFVMGTEGYASPQQINLEPASVQDDIYSLGALLIFILTGRDPKELLVGNTTGRSKLLSDAVNDSFLIQLAEVCTKEEADQRLPLCLLKSSVEEYTQMI